MSTVALIGTMVPDSRLEFVVDEIGEIQDSGFFQKFTSRQLRLGDFDPTAEDSNNVKQLQKSVKNADNIILATPLYHGSYSGSLKNMLDVLPRNAFEDKSVGIVVVSGGSYPRTGAEHLSTIARSLGGDVIPKDVLIENSTDRIEPDMNYIDQNVRNRLEKFVEELIE